MDVESGYEYGKEVSLGADAVIVGDVATKREGSPGVLFWRVTAVRAVVPESCHDVILRYCVICWGLRHHGTMEWAFDQGWASGEHRWQLERKQLPRRSFLTAGRICAHRGCPSA